MHGYRRSFSAHSDRGSASRRALTFSVREACSVAATGAETEARSYVGIWDEAAATTNKARPFPPSSCAPGGKPRTGSPPVPGALTEPGSARGSPRLPASPLKPQHLIPAPAKVRPGAALLSFASATTGQTERPHLTQDSPHSARRPSACDDRPAATRGRALEGRGVHSVASRLAPSSVISAVGCVIDKIKSSLFLGDGSSRSTVDSLDGFGAWLTVLTPGAAAGSTAPLVLSARSFVSGASASASSGGSSSFNLRVALHSSGNDCGAPSAANMAPLAEGADDEAHGCSGIKLGQHAAIPRLSLESSGSDATTSSSDSCGQRSPPASGTAATLSPDASPGRIQPANSAIVFKTAANSAFSLVRPEQVPPRSPTCDSKVSEMAERLPTILARIRVADKAHRRHSVSGGISTGVHERAHHHRKSRRSIVSFQDEFLAVLAATGGSDTWREAAACMPTGGV
jgi:hypothetical protein